MSEQNFALKKQPGPNTYDVQKLGFKTSNFFNAPTHKMSMTQRSNIAKQDMRTF
jgi:hypothetical protein